MKQMLAGLALLALVAVVGVALLSRDASATSGCRTIGGGITSSVTTEGCASPVGLCTTGDFSGNGLLNGTTLFTADALAPSAGMPGAEAPSTLSYSGLLTITTDKGTLTTRGTGIFDTARGLFSSRDIVVAGTGEFEGATGFLFFHGTGSSTFVSKASGEICRTD